MHSAGHYSIFQLFCSSTNVFSSGEGWPTAYSLLVVVLLESSYHLSWSGSYVLGVSERLFVPGLSSLLLLLSRHSRV